MIFCFVCMLRQRMWTCTSNLVLPFLEFHLVGLHQGWYDVRFMPVHVEVDTVWANCACEHVQVPLLDQRRGFLSWLSIHPVSFQALWTDAIQCDCIRVTAAGASIPRIYLFPRFYYLSCGTGTISTQLEKASVIPFYVSTWVLSTVICGALWPNLMGLNSFVT